MFKYKRTLLFGLLVAALTVLPLGVGMLSGAQIQPAIQQDPVKVEKVARFGFGVRFGRPYYRRPYYRPYYRRYYYRPYYRGYNYYPYRPYRFYRW